MQPRITVITRGVDELERSVAFYRDGLGLATQGIIGTEFENGAVAFFDLEGGIRLALWPWKSSAADTGLPMQDHGHFGGFQSRDALRSVAQSGRCSDPAGFGGTCT